VPVDVVESIAELRARLADARGDGKSIALVPTMGALHDGHLALVARARELADVVVVSIFVNPLQFGPAEDLDRYPRDLDADRARLDGLGVDLVFAPPVAEMYPEGFATRIEVGGPRSGCTSSGRRSRARRTVTRTGFSRSSSAYLTLLRSPPMTVVKFGPVIPFTGMPL